MAEAIRALIVEPLRQEAQRLAEDVRACGYEVECHCAGGVDEAAAALRGGNWDLLFADAGAGVGIPELLTLTHGWRLDLPVIILADRFDPQAAIAAIEAGAQDWLVKGDRDRLRLILTRELRGLRHCRRCQNALREGSKHERNYRLIFENLHDAAFLADAETGMLVECNRQAEALLGRSRDEILRMHQMELHPPGQRQRYQQLFEDARGRGSIHDADAHILRRDGTVVPTSLSGTTIQIAGRNFALGLFRDISQRRLTEQALQQSEARYRTLFQDSPISLWELDLAGIVAGIDEMRLAGVTDLDAYLREHPETLMRCVQEVRVLDVNRRTLELYEAAGRQDLAGALDRIIGPEMLKVSREIVLAIAAGRTGYQSEGIHHTLSGKRLYVTLRWRVAPGHERTYRRVLLSILDVTAGRQAEQALRESQRALSTLMANLPGMAYRCGHDEQYTIHFVSEGCRDLTGYAPEELVGNRRISFGELIHPDDRASVWQSIGAGLREKAPYQLVYRIITASGQVKWVWEQGQGLLSPDGRVEALEGFITDITRQKDAEQALRESEARFRRLAENAQDLIYRYRVAPSRAFEYVSPAATMMTGYTPDEFYADPGLGVAITHPEDVPIIRRHFESGRQASSPLVVRWRHRDGTWLVLEYRVTPVRDESGAVVAVEGIARDISDRKRAEEALHERARLRELSHQIIQSQEEERRRLSRELHDEAGQALTAIKLNTELLAKRIPPELPHLQRLASNAAETSANLINELRRIAAALRPAVLETLGLLATLRWYTKSLEMRYGIPVRLESHGLKGRLEPSFEAAIYRIVQEALTNIVRHAGASHAAVRVDCSNGGLELAISDDGRGMKPDVAAKGIGLIGIQERAHLFGGSVSVESQLKRGTTIRVHFPRVPEATA